MSSFTLRTREFEGPVESWGDGPPQNLGNPDDVKREITRLYPNIRWEREDTDKPEQQYAWFGRFDEDDLFTLQLLVHDNAFVCVISIGECEASMAENIAKHLGLVAIDEARFIGA